MNHTGTLIRAMRKRRGLSQWELAKGLGRSQTWISNFELGYKEPREDVLEQILAIISVLPNRNKSEE